MSALTPSELTLAKRAAGPLYYLIGCERSTSCEADLMLVITMSSDWYPEQPTAVGCPHARPEITLILSMVTLLHRECPRTLLETLVSETWWNIADSAPPSHKDAVKFNAVKGWRFWFPMSCMTVARISAKILAMITQHEGAEAQTALQKQIGSYDICAERATMSLKTFHGISTILHGKMTSNVPNVNEMTFEVPNTTGDQQAAYAFSGFRPLFTADDADEDDEDDEPDPEVTVVEDASQTNEPVSHALPDTHALYPFLATVQANSDIENQRHNLWQLSEPQRMSRSIQRGQYQPQAWVFQRQLLHDVSTVENGDLLTMCYPPAAPPAAAIGQTLDQATEFVGAGCFGSTIANNQVEQHEVSTSMFDQHWARVPVERTNAALATTPFDRVFSQKYPGLWGRRIANQALRAFYLKHFSFRVFLKERFVPEVRRMESLSVTSGWPVYTNELAKELRGLNNQIERSGIGLDEASRYAKQLDNRFDERMQRKVWADFSSTLVARNASVFLRDMHLTATQAMIVEYCLAAFGRLPDLFTVAQVVVIVVLGDFGQGKTFCIEMVQTLMPSGSQGQGSWISETALAHLSRDMLACFSACDEVRKEVSDLMQNTAIATRLSGRKRLKQCTKTNSFVEDLTEVLMDRALIIAGNDAPSDAIMNRAQKVFIGAHPGRRTAKQCAMAPGNEARQRGATAVFRRLYCRIYDNWHMDNLHATSLDNTIVRVLMGIYQAVMPDEYNQHSTRQFLAIRNLAMSNMKIRVTALWHNLVKHREPHDELIKYEFFAHRNWPTIVDAERALLTTLKLCDSTKMDRDVKGQIQAMIKFFNNRPVVVENNPLYYETELHVDRMAEQMMALLPVGYGKSIIRWYLHSLTEKSNKGGNAILVISNNSVRVLKSYVLDARGPAVQAVWSTLQWILANKHESYWGIDFDTETSLVFNNATKHLLLSANTNDDFPELPPTLANVTSQACKRAMHLLADAGYVWWQDDHRKLYYSSTEEMEKASSSHFCAQVFREETRGASKVIDGGGIERIYMDQNMFKLRNRLFGSAIAVKIDKFEQERDYDETGASQTAERQKILEVASAVCGGVAPGRYAWGLSSNSNSQFNESTLVGRDYGPIFIDNPNGDIDSAGVLRAPLRNQELPPLERIFPSSYKRIQLSSAWNISEIVQQHISRQNTNSKCPFKWSTWVTDNHAVTLQASFDGVVHPVLVPMFGPFTLEYVFREQIDNLPANFDVIGEVDKQTIVIAINDVRKESLGNYNVAVMHRTQAQRKKRRVQIDSDSE